MPRSRTASRVPVRTAVSVWSVTEESHVPVRQGELTNTHSSVYLTPSGQVRSGQVRSECLTYTVRSGQRV